MPEIPLPQPKEPDIFSYGFDRSLQRPRLTTPGTVVQDIPTDYERPEGSVIFDPDGGHNHNGVNSRRISFPAGLGNGKIKTSVSSNNLTVSLSTLSNNAPSTEDSIYVEINGQIRVISSKLELTLNSGTNWFNAGASSATTGTNADLEVDYFVYVIWNTTDNAVSLGIARSSHNLTMATFHATNTHSNYLAYTGSAPASTDDVRVIGRINATLSASNNWSIPSTSVIIQSPIYFTRQLTFTPGWQGTGSNPAIGNGSISGRYQFNQWGLDIYITTSMGSTTTFGSGTYRWYVPFWSFVGTRASGGGRILDSGTADRGISSTFAAGSSSYIEARYDAGSVGATTPITFAVNDNIQFTTTYRFLDSPV